MLHLDIDDPLIERYFQSKESILSFLHTIAENQLDITDLAPKAELLTQDRIISLTSKYFFDKPVLRAFLFGSYARETASVESDVDILIELDESQIVGVLFFRMSLELEGLLGKKVDLLSAKAIIPEMKENIEREKVLLYERKD